MPRAPKKEREGSRLQTLKKDGVQPALPDVTCSYLLDYLMEVGPTTASGFGSTPLTHQELQAWQVNMRRFLQPWEILVLRRLSVEWCAQASLSEDETCPPPFATDATDARLRSVATSMKAAIKAMAK